MRSVAVSHSAHPFDRRESPSYYCATMPKTNRTRRDLVLIAAGVVGGLVLVVVGLIIGLPPAGTNCRAPRRCPRSDETTAGLWCLLIGATFLIISGVLFVKPVLEKRRSAKRAE